MQQYRYYHNIPRTRIFEVVDVQISMPWRPWTKIESPGVLVSRHTPLADSFASGRHGFLNDESNSRNRVGRAGARELEAPPENNCEAPV